MSPTVCVYVSLYWWTFFSDWKIGLASIVSSCVSHYVLLTCHHQIASLLFNTRENSNNNNVLHLFAWTELYGVHVHLVHIGISCRSLCACDRVISILLSWICAHASDFAQKEAQRDRERAIEFICFISSLWKWCSPSNGLTDRNAINKYGLHWFACVKKHIV